MGLFDWLLLRLQREFVPVAEISIAEAVQKTKASDAVESCWSCRHSHGKDIVRELECGNFEWQGIHGMGPRVRTAERDRFEWNAATDQAIHFVQDELKRVLQSSSACVGQQRPWDLLSSLRESENDLNYRPIVQQRPLGADHHPTSQIS